MFILNRGWQDTPCKWKIKQACPCGQRVEDAAASTSLHTGWEVQISPALLPTETQSLFTWVWFWFDTPRQNACRTVFEVRFA